MPKINYVYGTRGSGKSVKLLEHRDNHNRDAYIVTYSEIAAKDLQDRATHLGLCSKNIISISELSKHYAILSIHPTLYIDDLDICFLRLLRWHIEKDTNLKLLFPSNLLCAITQSPSDICLGDSIDTTETRETEITDKCEIESEVPPTIHISGETININFPPEWK